MIILFNFLKNMYIIYNNNNNNNNNNKVGIIGVVPSILPQPSFHSSKTSNSIFSAFVYLLFKISFQQARRDLSDAVSLFA